MGAARLSRRTTPLVVTGVVLAVALGLLELLLQRSDPFWAEDLAVYQFSGSAVRSGAVPYVTAYAPGLEFVYPPFAAILFVPLSLVTITVVAPVLVVLSLLCLEGMLWYSWGLVGLRDPLHRALATFAGIAAVMWLDPVRDTLRLGQINLILALLVIVDVARTGRRAQGVLIGIATGVKLTPAIFIIYLLVTRRVRAATIAAVAFIGTIVLSAIVIPKATYTYWTSLVFDTNRFGLVQSTFSQSLRSALARVLHDADHLTLLWLITGLVVGVWGITLAAWTARCDQELLGLAVTGITGVLVAPISWDHHWVWVVPGLVFTIGMLVSRGLPAVVRVGVAAFVVLLVVAFTVRPQDWVSHDPQQDLHLAGVNLLYADVYVLFGLVTLALVGLWGPVGHAAYSRVRSRRRWS
jgi:glycosyl transferase family 87